jgi:hypothetical protein
MACELAIAGPRSSVSRTLVTRRPFLGGRVASAAAENYWTTESRLTSCPETDNSNKERVEL